MAGRLGGNCIEEHSDTLGMLYDLEFSQIEPGEHGLAIGFLATESCVIYREEYAAKTYALGSLKGRRFGFALPLREAGSKWWGKRREAAWIPTTLSGELIDASFARSHAHIVVVVDLDRLHAALQRAGFPAAVLRSVEGGRRGPMLGFDRASLDVWTARFGRMLDAALAGRLQLSAPKLEECCLEAAISLLDRSDGSAPRDRRGSELFRRALQVSRQEGYYPSIGSLCEALRASPRTLEAAFRECAGISPHRFFHLQRLNRARRELARSWSEEARVTDIALGLGFTELGRFAGQYRKLFGELPSETLRRQPRTTVAIPF